MRPAALALICCLSFAAFAQTPPAASPATPAEAQAFMDRAEKTLNDLGIKAARASWVQETFITDDTEAISADAQAQFTAAITQLATDARRFDGLKLSPELARKFYLLKLQLAAPAPSDPAKQAELTRITVSMDSDYGKGKYCPDSTPDHCLDVTAIEAKMASSRDPQELLALWKGWHAVGAPMRQRYARFVELSNEGAREMGFSDVGAMWRSNYDMPPDQFEQEIDRLWSQLKPFYLQLHAYTRQSLEKKYGAAALPKDGTLPADLLGNPWAQTWDNIYDLMAPRQGAETFDLTKLLQDKKVDPLGMVKYGEGFFTSLGFAPLPKTFWERSQFIKPRDRDVVCHASAWDVDNKEDLRLKVCLQIRGEDFITVHHELGHNFYQRAYMNQPPLFETSANDGFHEAIGDTIALSVTPDYLKQIGLLQTIPDPSSDTGYLLKKSLEKVAFLPFALVVDKWRWEVFSGKIQPQDYEKEWWRLRREYEGITPPVARTEADFDPGAKYHIPANVPYMRYFLADIYQFQFYRALCKTAGYQGPLHRCSFYNSKPAGQRLNQMLEMGASRPWPVAMQELTGQPNADASAIVEYFQPLMSWLEAQNKGQRIGWDGQK